MNVSDILMLVYTSYAYTFSVACRIDGTAGFMSEKMWFLQILSVDMWIIFGLHQNIGP